MYPKKRALTRSISDNTKLHKRKQQLAKLEDKNNEFDFAKFNRSLPTDIKMKTDERNISRISSVSSDSASTKKPASIDEIQDLYSALQDLVKTNVTTTPVPKRRQFKTKSAGNSPTISAERRHERTSTVPEKYLRQFTSKSKTKENSLPSTFETKQEIKYKRGISSGGTLDMMLRISPFPNRKFHSNNHASEEKSKKQNNNNKTTKKNSLETNKKWKGPKLFHRLRSKSVTELNSEEENENTDHSNSDSSPPISTNGTNRRRSEGDSLKLRDKNKRANKNQRRSYQEDSEKKPHHNVSDIDQLVADLDQQEMNTTAFDGVDGRPGTTFTSNELELTQLESWFVNAAAEATMNHSKQSLSRNHDNSESEGDDNSTTISRDGDGRRKSNSVKLNSAVRRTSSSAARSKDNRKLKRGRFSSRSFDAISYARSTPELNTGDKHTDEDERLNNVSENANSKIPGKLTPFTENNLKGDCSTTTSSRKISLDAGIGRLPGAPLFYTPDDGTNSSIFKTESTTTTTSTTTSSITADKKIKHCSKDMFYSEEKNSEEKNEDDDRNSDEKCCSKSTTGTTDDVKRNNSENRRRNNNKKQKPRPKSMFDYLGQDSSAFIDDLRTGDKLTDDLQNTLQLELDMQTDSNANFCRTKTLNNTHAVSLSDLTKTPTNQVIVQERSLWNRFRKGNSAKKSKAIMA